MEKLFKRIFFAFIMFLLVNVVKAEQFKIGEYIDGEYIKMVSDTTSKYLTIQIIRDSNNNFVYCIEPYVLVDENETNYVIHESDLSSYSNLTEEQKRKISLIAYYGYGYKDRMTKKWYAITQMLIWRIVDPNSEFYFTDQPNGAKVDKYSGYMNSIFSDVYNHDMTPSFIKDYNVNYNGDLVIDKFNDIYDIGTEYDYNYNNSKLTISNINKDGSVSFQRKNDLLRNVTIYDSPNSQDLIRRGNVIEVKHTINIKVNSGNITLDIRKDKENVYSVESDFTNTCYEIISNSSVLDKVCTSNDNLVYKTSELPFGEYIVKQVSVGKGYEVDLTEYKIVIDGTNDTNVVLNNKLIKNKIELVKYYCIKDNCLYEENAVFNVYDISNSLVGSITTDINGYGFLEVGYGKYTIVQQGGLENYTFVDEYSEEVVNSTDRYYKELYNYYIEEVVGGFGTTIPDNLEENENNDNMLPPVTGTKLAELLKILYNVIMIVICSCNLRRFCYNN